jgi:ATP-binding cassette subfamily B protein
MLMRTFAELLGEQQRVLRRYAALAVAYGLLGGLTTVLLVPILLRLLAGDVRGAAAWLAALALGLAACWALRRHVDRAGVAVGVALLQTARQRVGDHVARLPVGWFTPHHTARLGHVLTQGMMALAQLPAHVLTPVVSGAVAPLVALAALWVLHPPLGLAALLALPVLAGVSLAVARLGRQAEQAFHHHFAQASQRMVEFAQAQSVLRAFNGEGGGTRLLEQAMERQHQAGRRLVWRSSAAAVLNGWAVQAVFATLLVVWLQDSQGAAPVGAALVALVLVNRFIDPLLDVAGYGEILRGVRGQLAAVREILDATPMPEPDRPQVLGDASVVLRGVGFCYAPGQPEVLHGVDLRVAPGSMVALVGASGSGKTTLLRLVARFFDVNAGSVLVGGVDVRDMPGEQLAGQISQIFQDTALLAGSMADNIRMGRPGASDEEVLQVAHQAGLGEIIARLPQGLATPVGEGGARLSGGERQRVAIARALLKQAPILLVDEATAALDAENQAAITQALARLRGRCTLVVIAHQLSTVAMADQVVVLDGGRVCEQGTPAQLAASGGRYAQFLAQRRAAQGWRLAPAGN